MVETGETPRIKKIMADTYADLEKYADTSRHRRGIRRKSERWQIDLPAHNPHLSNTAARHAVIAVSPNGGETHYESVGEAAEAWGVTNATISNYLHGKTSPPNGVLFRYEGKEAVVKIGKTRESRFVAVVAIDSEGNETRYPSLGEAAEATRTHKQTISSCLHGRYKTTGGYRWKFDNEKEAGKCAK
jgi:hypothetical protein